MNDFFIQNEKDFLELSSQDQKTILEGLREAIEKELLVSIRGQEFHEEPVLYGDGVYMMTLNEKDDYYSFGGTWDYEDPKGLLEIFKPNGKED